MNLVTGARLVCGDEPIAFFPAICIAHSYGVCYVDCVVFPSLARGGATLIPIRTVRSLSPGRESGSARSDHLHGMSNRLRAWALRNRIDFGCLGSRLRLCCGVRRVGYYDESYMMKMYQDASGRYRLSHCYNKNCDKVNPKNPKVPKEAPKTESTTTKRQS